MFFGISDMHQRRPEGFVRRGADTSLMSNLARSLQTHAEVAAAHFSDFLSNISFSLWSSVKGHLQGIDTKSNPLIGSVVQSMTALLKVVWMALRFAKMTSHWCCDCVEAFIHFGFAYKCLMNCSGIQGHGNGRPDAPGDYISETWPTVRAI